MFDKINLQTEHVLINNIHPKVGNNLFCQCLISSIYHEFLINVVNFLHRLTLYKLCAILASHIISLSESAQ